MANIAYLSIKGKTQGLISAGCCSLDSIGNKGQSSHIDQIMVYAITHNISRHMNVNHHEIVVVKPVDKSSPLLGKAISENEELNCVIEVYRTNRSGMNELFYKLTLSQARIMDIDFVLPHTMLEPGGEIQEKIAFSYESIGWEHCTAKTSAFSFWSDRIQ